MFLYFIFQSVSNINVNGRFMLWAILLVEMSLSLQNKMIDALVFLQFNSQLLLVSNFQYHPERMLNPQRSNCKFRILNLILKLRNSLSKPFLIRQRHITHFLPIILFNQTNLLPDRKPMINPITIINFIDHCNKSQFRQ